VFGGPGHGDRLLPEQKGRRELGRLLGEVVDEGTGPDPGQPGDVVDVLLRIQRRHLPPYLGEAVDDRDRQAAEPGAVGAV
jgi:hypothetical protein